MAVDGDRRLAGSDDKSWLAYGTLMPTAALSFVGVSVSSMVRSLHMANMLSSPNVCGQLHDRIAARWQTANMTKKARWHLKAWRKHRGYTQDRLSEMVGISKPYLSQLESGKRQWSQELIERLAEALQCGPADLIVRDPTDPDGIWSVWDQLHPADQQRVVEVAKTFKRTGTGG